jgi:MFS family permease
MVFADTLPVFLGACVLSGLGHSLAIPGYNSVLSLRVEADEQGGAAGLIASVNGFTLVLGPLAATALYQAGVALPFVCGAGVLALLTAFLVLNPGVRDRHGDRDQDGVRDQDGARDRDGVRAPESAAARLPSPPRRSEQ